MKNGKTTGIMEFLFLHLSKASKDTLPNSSCRTNSWNLKNDAWKTTFCNGNGPLSLDMSVSFHQIWRDLGDGEE